MTKQFWRTIFAGDAKLTGIFCGPKQATGNGEKERTVLGLLILLVWNLRPNQGTEVVEDRKRSVTEPLMLRVCGSFRLVSAAALSSLKPGLHQTRSRQRICFGISQNGTQHCGAAPPSVLGVATILKMNRCKTPRCRIGAAPRPRTALGVARALEFYTYHSNCKKSVFHSVVCPPDPRTLRKSLLCPQVKRLLLGWHQEFRGYNDVGVRNYLSSGPESYTFSFCQERTRRGGAFPDQFQMSQFHRPTRWHSQY